MGQTKHRLQIGPFVATIGEDKCHLILHAEPLRSPFTGTKKDEKECVNGELVPCFDFRPRFSCEGFLSAPKLYLFFSFPLCAPDLCLVSRPLHSPVQTSLIVSSLIFSPPVVAPTLSDFLSLVFFFFDCGSCTAGPPVRGAEDILERRRRPSNANPNRVCVSVC